MNMAPCLNSDCRGRERRGVDSWNLYPTYCNVDGGYLGAGNIDARPRFVTYRGFDYVLHPDSPCVDSGDPAIEDDVYDADPRRPAGIVNGARSDMGAYGGNYNDGWV
jgi:hypothetical protein